VIRLLVADDQALVRGALSALLSLEADIEVVAEVGRGDEVVDAARASAADVALLDIEMPGIDGIAAAAELRAAMPSCRVLIVTTFGRPGYLVRAMQAGASGFVVKDTPSAQLADAVRRVACGRTQRRFDRRSGAHPAPVGGHRAQPPVCRDRQDGRAQPRRCRAHSGAERLALNAPTSPRNWAHIDVRLAG
jgi:DNA-binding NarL/FixJ family response regulator